MKGLTELLTELVKKYPEIKDTIWYYDFKKYADIEKELGIDLITLFSDESIKIQILGLLDYKKFKKETNKATIERFMNNVRKD